jgi:hypothetical protein
MVLYRGRSKLSSTYQGKKGQQGTLRSESLGVFWFWFTSFSKGYVKGNR